MRATRVISTSGPFPFRLRFAGCTEPRLLALYPLNYAIDARDWHQTGSADIGTAKTAIGKRHLAAARADRGPKAQRSIRPHPFGSDGWPLRFRCHLACSSLGRVLSAITRRISAIGMSSFAPSLTLAIFPS